MFLIVATAGTLWYGYERFLAYTSPETKTLYFEKGTSLRKMSRLLEAEGVIEDSRIFEVWVRAQKKDSQLQAGEYEFPAGSNSQQTLDLILSGKVKTYPLTVREGLNFKEIGQVVASRGLTTDHEWLNLVTDAELIKDLGIPASNLEGYLFPSTYLLERRTTAPYLVREMVGLFRKKATPELIAEAKAQNLTLHQWVTLASIVEKETGAASERPIIAGVFLNRLKIGMLLQTDPTVIYGIPNFNGNLTREDLMTDTPYNTYTRPGLPPGPICSPGIEALMAVIRPAKTEYLYFVGKGDGTHYFSGNLEEHNWAVNYYQRKIGPPPPGASPN